MRLLFLFLGTTVLGIGCAHPSGANNGGSAKNAMVEKNVAVVRRVIEEALNKGNMAVLDKLVAENYKRHCQAGPPMPVNSRADLKKLFTATRAAFPDWHEKVEFIFGSGNYVAHKNTATGTQQHDLGPMKATNKKVVSHSVVIHRLENGKIVETWAGWDMLSFLMQLGHMKPPGPPPAKKE